MRTVDFYRLPNSDSPVEAFLDSLTGRQAQKVLWVLQLIEELDVVPRQYFKKLVDSEGIWEVRIQFGNDIFRLLGFFDSGALLILTNGFAKKTQKTPPQEIALAIRRKEEYLARRKNHERCKTIYSKTR
jgi:phage-related protein